MDETKQDLSEVKTETLEHTQVSTGHETTKHGNRNLLLAISAIVIGAAIVIGVFNASFPTPATDDSEVTTSTTSVKDVNNVSSLDSVDKELDTTSLDDYQTELNQNDTDAASF